MKKRRRLRKEIVVALRVILAIVIVAIIVLVANFNINFVGAKSSHEDALSYKTRKVLVYYPDCKSGRQIAKEIGKNADKNAIIDYELIPYGDYLQVTYPDGTCYYIDDKYEVLEVNEINDELKPIVSDLLRYQMKEAEIDRAYTLEFLEETYYENIDFKKTESYINGENLVIHFDRYEFDCAVPLKYAQIPLGINLGYDNETYVKQRYISKDRKKICFTFDDGPYIATSSQIVDELYIYDSSATFFLLGIRLNEDNINFCKESIEKGMEYGSHTQNHKSFKKISFDTALEEIYTPYNELNNNINYQMKLYRPPYGDRVSKVEEAVDLTAVLWNVDSLDWSYRTKLGHDACVKAICNEVETKADENDVVLFHDIYETSVDAIKELIPYYINQGYQIVSVSELMESLGINNVNSFSGK